MSLACLRIVSPRLSAALLLLLAGITTAAAQTTAFTYQGRLADNGTPASGTYDFQFTLFDTATLGTGTPQGGPLTVPAVQVTGGLFTVPLDFGTGAFPGPDRFLEIAVKKPSDPAFTTLGPRQPLTSNPYAIRSLGAAASDGLSVACVNCVTSTQIQSVQGSQVTGPIAGGQISGEIPAASVPAGSGHYIQNGTSPQAASFNVSGNGTAAIFDAGTQFNLGGQRVMSTAGTDNLFVGVGAGTTDASFGNAFFGKNAGPVNMARYNSFFGFSAGASTTSGCCNSFVGNFVGFSNTTGRSNVFMGGSAGHGNTSGSFNVFLGDGAGFTDFISGNTTGSFNTFVGYVSGRAVVTGNNNTLLGYNTTGAANLDHATAIGADAVVGTSNTVVLGRSADTVQVPGSLNATGAVGAGTQYNLGGSRILSRAGTANLFAGTGAGAANTGAGNAFFGFEAGLNNTTAGSNAFFGNGAGRANTTGVQNSFFGSGAGQGNSTGGLNAFFGHSSGGGNTGSQNAFFGQATGISTAGSFNTFVGQAAGNNPGSGSNNTFVGWFAGAAYGTADNNTFVGSLAGFTTPTPPTPTGSNNTALGAGAKVDSGLLNAGAIGAFARVTQSDSLVLGALGASVGIGTTAPQARLHIAEGTGRAFVGVPGCAGPYLGIGFEAPLSGCTNYALLGGDGNTYINRPTGGAIHFRENNFDQVRINAGGTLSIGALGAGGFTALCRNGANEISFCVSSLRYKTDLSAFTGGMELVDRLRPITFKWKHGGAADVGLGAEEVAEVEPLLVTRNERGEVEGVKYDHLSVVFVNALKEQQVQIDDQRRQIEAQRERLDRQQREIEALRTLVLDARAAMGSDPATASARRR